MILPILCLWAFLSPAQDLPPISAATDYARLRAGVDPPKLLHSTDPVYTPEAMEAGIQGTVVLHAVVDTQGNVAYASLLSPLPAGLDAKALAAVKHWRYTPGEMDGEIIPVLTTIDVLFRPPYKPVDAAAEQRRKEFGGISARVLTAKLTPTSEEVRELKDLASHGLMAAVGLLGECSALGLGVSKNIPEGMAKLQAAADHNDANALFFLGSAELSGRLIPRNEAHGWQLIQRAAYLGNSGAQSEVGDKYERQSNWNEGKRYFRMCAATAHAGCEYQLGKLLVDGPAGNPDDFAQGVAWLELSKGHADQRARALWEISVAKLSSIQLEWVAQLKPHLELKNFRGF